MGGDILDDLSFGDENVGWPSYVDFLSTFIFVLILFVGSLLYLLSGDIQERLIQAKVQPYSKSLSDQGVFNVVEGKKIKLPLKGMVEFDVGRSTLLEKHIPYLRRIGSMLARAPGSKRIVVRGYADSSPFANDPFGNWRLSSERALNILRFFYDCKDCGYGEDVRRQLTLTGEGDLDAKREKSGRADDGKDDRRVDIFIEFGDANGR